MSYPTTVDRRSVFAWAMYDFANSSYAALVLTFIFSTYFANEVAANEVIGTTLWGRALTISSLLVAALSPLMGALADAGGLRKRFLFFLTLMGVSGTLSLYGVLPGQVTKGIVLFVFANLGMEMGMVFYNAFLPDIAPLDRIGRISGYGWAFGYLGGLLAMTIALVGFVFPDQPWFGLSKENFEHIRATNLLVGLWFGLFSIPIFVWVKDKARITPVRTGSLLASTYRQLGQTFREIKRYRQIARFLIARIFYNDAVVTLYSFGGIYARGTMGFSFTEIMIFGIVLNITAGLGAFALGFLDDRIGGIKTIQLTNIAFVFATFMAILAPNKLWFWIAGVLVGCFVGPSQAASRSVMGRFVPLGKENEFFGFYAFSGKATAFLGPLLLGEVNQIFGSQRAGVSIIVVLFIIGAVILTSVDEEEGKRVAGRQVPGSGFKVPD